VHVFPPLAEPVIHAIIPETGSVTGGTDVVILGNNFVDGVQVVFGSQLLSTTVCTIV
jgi:hypothetical protein